MRLLMCAAFPHVRSVRDRCGISSNTLLQLERESVALFFLGTRFGVYPGVFKSYLSWVPRSQHVFMALTLQQKRRSMLGVSVRGTLC